MKNALLQAQKAPSKPVDRILKPPAQRAEDLIAESGISFMPPSEFTNWNGQEDVRRTLINAIGKGISEKGLLQALHASIKKGSPVNAAYAIIKLNCEMVPSLKEEFSRKEAHRESLLQSKQTDGKGFSLDESKALKAMGVPKKAIDSSELSDPHIYRIKRVLDFLLSLEILSETQYTLVCERFGADTGEIEPIKEIAKTHGTNRSNVRASICAACKKIVENAALHAL